MGSFSAMMFITVAVSGCVSSTLETTKAAAPQPVSTMAPTSILSLSQEERKTDQLRAEGIAEIHAKADAAPVNAEAPAYGLPRQGETTLLTPQEIAAKTASLNQTNAKANAQIPDAELLAHQRKMKALRNKGRTHYRTALKKIGN